MTTYTRPPGPRSRFPGQFAFRLARDPLPFLTGLVRAYGDVVRFDIGPQPVFVLNDPEAIRDVLVTHQKNFTKGRGLERTKMLLGEGLLTSEGSFHLRQRRLVQPAFHRDRVHALGATMATYAERCAARWRPGQTLDVAGEMMRLTLGIVGKTLFDADVESESTEIGQAITASLEAFSLGVLPFGEWMDKLPLPHVVRFRRARARLDATIYRFIAEHRARGGEGGDLLSMLLLSRDDEEDGGQLTDTQLRDEAMTLFLAGHETTANLLTWTWYVLGEHTSVAARLHDELDAELRGRTPTADDLPRLPYTRMVLAESMRLYPPAWILGRRAIGAYRVAGYSVPPRAIVLMSQYVTHRDARWYPEPERFDPERWTAAAVANRPKFAYYPFGAGSRICVGEQFAWMEATLALATLAQRWQLRLVPGHRVVPQPRVTLRPRYGMLMTVEQRNSY